MSKRGGHEFGLVWSDFFAKFKTSRMFPSVYFGVVLVVLVKGVKQSQLLVPRLKSGLWTGV